MGGLKYPAWEKPYLAAMLELDPQKLAQRVKAAQLAILLRLQELRASLDGSAEREAIEDAQSGLLVLRKECARFPAMANGPAHPRTHDGETRSLPS